MTTRDDRSLAPTTTAALLEIYAAVQRLERAWMTYTTRWPFHGDAAAPEGVQMALYGHADGTMTCTVDAGPVEDLVLVERLAERVDAYVGAAR